jgi:hypothetical protein
LFCWQSFFSSASMGREASEMSVLPAQKASNPPLVPEEPTVTWTFGCSWAYSSAAAELSGSTVEEPSIFTAPETASPAEPCWPPHAARLRVRASATDAGAA